MARLPTLFVSHGSPMHALDAGGAGPAWEALGASLPRPSAILAVSAHCVYSAIDAGVLSMDAYRFD